MKNAAQLITKILSPVTTGLATLVIAIFVQQIALSQKIFWFALALSMAIVPMAIIYLQYKSGKITSLWSPSALERRDSFMSWVLISFIFSAISFWLDAPRLIFALGLVFLVLGAVNFLLTSIFKISIHSEMVTLLVITAILSVSVGYIFLVLLIPLVGWARIYLKNHTLSEVSYGALLSVLAVYFVFYIFGLATF